MGEKIVVGPVNKGLKTDRLPFNIDNDSFPTLINAYQWRGRIKRRRGTSLLTRLTRFFNSANASYFPAPGTIALSGGNQNLFLGFSLQTYSNIVPTTVSIQNTVTTEIYTDPAGNGVLVGNAGHFGTVNYANGNVTLTGMGANTITAQFLYYPDLPVMGLEDLILSANFFPATLAFDTVYSYIIQNVVDTANNQYDSYDVSFYANPQTGTYAGYTQKTDVTPTTWNGNDYQQFWTTNYEGALWATNGIADPFDKTKISMQFENNGTIAWINATTLHIDYASAVPVVGDFVFLNEITTTSAVTTGKLQSINYQTGFVTAVAGPTRTIVFPDANIIDPATGAPGVYQNGISQLLTNRSDKTKDCIRFYTGDPTNGSATTPVLNGHQGWVNFMPPLSNQAFSIGDAPANQYYLVGARIILPFKDRLLFIGPVIQTSSANSQIYLQDTVIFSQNGTPYYTASFNGDPTLATTTFFPILVPDNKTATANAYFADVVGFGGNLTAGFATPIITAQPNEDVIIMGFTNRQARFVYTGNDFIPFNFFVVNSEYGSNSTFSAITLDRGVLSIGARGLIISSQVSAQRVDLEIPDQIFEIGLINNGAERICAGRDFENEWIYFTYMTNQDDPVQVPFPNQTLLYNYRDNSWGIFNECYTTYGQFRKQTGYTWATLPFPTWSSWDEPWDEGAVTVDQPEVICGNQQGFVFVREETTGEQASLEITSTRQTAAITGATQAASCVLTANNNFTVGDTLLILNVNGMTQLNGNTYTITAVTQTTITLGVNSLAFGAYTSGGVAQSAFDIFAPNHCLNAGDYIQINGVLGGAGSLVNGNIYSVSPSLTVDNFNLNPTPFNFAPVVITGASQANPCVLTAINNFAVGDTIIINNVVGMVQLNTNTFTITARTETTITLNVDSSAFGAYVSGGFAYLNESYVGSGEIVRMYVPQIQTKQFPPSWGMSRKTRIGVQQYLFSTTEAGKIELQIFLSQNSSNAYNSPPYYPNPNNNNSSVIYTDTLFTSPEYAIQTCPNMSLGNIGDGINTTYNLSLQSLFNFPNRLVPGSLVITVGSIATFTDNGTGGFTVTGTGNAVGSSVTYSSGNVTLVFTAAPSATASTATFQYYYNNILSPTASQQQQIWHRMNTSLLGDTVQVGFTMNDAQMRDTSFSNQFAEIELHGFILDVQPSQVLA